MTCYLKFMLYLQKPGKNLYIFKIFVMMKGSHQTDVTKTFLGRNKNLTISDTMSSCLNS